MTTPNTPPPSARRGRLARLWKGNGQPSRWYLRIILLFILYQALIWLWQNSLLTARWAQPGKTFSFVFIGAMGLVTLWLVTTGWRLVSRLGLRGLIILLLLWYLLAVGLRLLQQPPEQSLLAALPGQLESVLRESATSLNRNLRSLPQALDEFQFAFTGQRDLMDLPGAAEPAQALHGPIIEPNYYTLVETAAPQPGSETPEVTPTPPLSP